MRSRHSDGVELNVLLKVELTPKLKYISLTTGYLRGEIFLSNLVTVKVVGFYIGSCIDSFLSAATMLAVYYTKNTLHDVTELHVASYVLERHDICGDLQFGELTIWAPNMNLLGLKNCNSIERMSFGNISELEAFFLPTTRIPPTLGIYLPSDFAHSALVALATHPKGVFVAE